MYTAPLPAARAKIVPVIVVPGITASVLTDWYPASPREIWSPTRLAFGDYEPMTLHPAPPTPAGDAAGDGRAAYDLTEIRRVKFYDKNYYDHPAFGVIALVTPANGGRAPGR